MRISFISCLVQACVILRVGSLHVQYPLDQNFRKQFLLGKIFFNSPNLNRDVILKVSVKAVQGISHGNKVFPQTFPNKLSFVAGK